MSEQQYRAHQSVKVKTGKWAGAVGTVEDTRADTGMVKVQFSGVLNSEPLDKAIWFKAGALEAAT